MAQTTQDITLLPDSTGQEVKEKAAESERGLVEGAGAQLVGDSSSSTPFVADADPHAEKISSQDSTDPQPSALPPRPSLVPLGSSHAQTSSSTPVAPHPKRFSAVNINKKFLEKNTASGSAAISSSSSNTKSGSAAARPSVQATSSHSRLVAAKLTASPAVPSSTAGWSRSSSVAPSPATVATSQGSTSPLPATASTQTSTATAPQLPHVGKVIQPQPRNATSQLGPLQKETGNKPVWGNVKPPTAMPIRPDIQASDFPTAAEVANVAITVRKHIKAEDDAKATSDTAAKQLRSEEADTFRGVHLDPNAHHWDEMEEDDDNFLGGVIEFGDGRQYKIESSESQQTDLSPVPIAKVDRFLDDFDRSWPKSRGSPASVSRDFPPISATHLTSPNVSPVISHATHSPQDSSRVLFNERSNRLEPYSQSHRPGQGPFSSKRSSYQEGHGPSMESPRSVWEGSHNIQVLQKPSGGDFGSGGRRFSGSSGGFGPSTSSGFVGGHRDREQPPGRRDGPPPSPRMPRDQAMDKDRDFDRGRRTTMGPPPLPLHAIHAQESGRQLPPHLSQVSPDTIPRRLPSRESRYATSEPPLSAGLPPSTSARLPPQSPALSHASLMLVSPGSASNIALVPELDEVQKDVMHSAAARAKQRRQQEEEEREAQKERARHKAAELEKKMMADEAEKAKQKEAEEASKAAKEKEAIAVIEEAVKSLEVSTEHTEDNQQSDFVKPMLKRPPSSKALPTLSTTDLLRSGGPPRTGTIPSRSVPVSAAAVSPVLQTESWRARANLLPPATPKQIQPRPLTSPFFVASGPSAAEQVETIADGSKDDLEVVDFSDMGKFVGVPETSEQTSEAVPEVKLGTSILSRPSRPVASDFFEEPTVMESPMSASKKADFGAWRRKVSQDVSESPPAPPQRQDVKVEVVNEAKKVEGSTQTYISIEITSKEHLSDGSFSPEQSMTSTKEPLGHFDNAQGQTVHVPPHFNSQRTPRGQTFYKEATMSALDSAMSRIKGVLSGMHTHDAPKEVSQSSSHDSEVQPLIVQLAPPPKTTSRPLVKERWVPRALRARMYDDGDESREVFHVTVLELPTSPPPTSTAITIRLPSVSRPVDLISKKQLYAFWRPPYQARMDILSFDPPVYDMNRRDLSLNDVLFRRPIAGFRGKVRYRVVLPRYRGPKVQIPSGTLTKANGLGAFGRPTVADGATSWRKAVVSTMVETDSVSEETDLNTMSRSPPPEIMPPETAVASIPKSAENSPTKSDSSQAIRSRSQPKMPEGSAVAYMRDSRIDVVEADPKPLVNFIVGSQLEDSTQTAPTTTSEASKVVPSPVIPVLEAKAEASKPMVNGLISSSLSEDDMERTSSFNDSTDHDLITPPNHHVPGSWARSSVSLTIKDSPARAPDPEHLKAVWSQPSNKVGIHPVNSLEGIADDLTALPFTLQDVKSEDGETPPPQLPSAPSRMSLHDVTRAFQQVPTSSSSASQPPHRDRATISPPSTNAPVARPTTAAYAYSPGPQNMRPSYAAYPSPMMSHSPAPMMYGHPSPVPSRMQLSGHNGHTPLYSQPMWMTMPGPSPQPQANMMRPLPSPYPAQMMAYPSPGYAPQHPPPNMLPTTPQAQNGGRGRGMPVMSPVMSHAHTHPGSMYGGSPVMLHAVQVPQNHGYMPMPAGRGQPRLENGQMPAPQHQHTPHSNHLPPSHVGFNPGPTSQFVRSAW